MYELLDFSWVFVQAPLVFIFMFHIFRNSDIIYFKPSSPEWIVLYPPVSELYLQYRGRSPIGADWSRCTFTIELVITRVIKTMPLITTKCLILSSVTPRRVRSGVHQYAQVSPSVIIFDISLLREISPDLIYVAEDNLDQCQIISSSVHPLQP